MQQKVGRNILNRPRLPVPMYLPTCLLCDECTHTYAHTHTHAHTRTYAHTHARTRTHTDPNARDQTPLLVLHMLMFSLSLSLGLSPPLYLPRSSPLRPIGLSAHSLVCCQPHPPTRCLSYTTLPQQSPWKALLGTLTVHVCKCNLPSQQGQARPKAPTQCG